MQRLGFTVAIAGAILVRAEPQREAEKWAGDALARGEVDFVDLAGNTVVSPFRWRARLPRAAPVPVDAMVLIDDNYFQEFPGVLPPLGGFSGAEILPAGSPARHALIPRPRPSTPAHLHTRARASTAPAAH